MDIQKKNAILFKHLYYTLTTSQIEKAVRDSKLKYEDWLNFQEYMQKQLEG